MLSRRPTSWLTHVDVALKDGEASYADVRREGRDKRNRNAARKDYKRIRSRTENDKRQRTTNRSADYDLSDNTKPPTTGTTRTEREKKVTEPRHTRLETKRRTTGQDFDANTRLFKNENKRSLKDSQKINIIKGVQTVL